VASYVANASAPPHLALVVDKGECEAPNLSKFCQALSSKRDTEFRYVGMSDPAYAQLNQQSWSSASGFKSMRGLTQKNAMLLASAGSRVVAVADTTLGVGWSTGESRALDLSGHADPLQYEFFETRAAAVAVPSHGGDILSDHGQVLGRSLKDVLRQFRDCDPKGACSHIRTLLGDSMYEPRVRISQAGIAGDVGERSPRDILFSSGRLREQLRADRGLFERALGFREVRRVAERFVISHELRADFSCVGLDNARILPPFIPVEGISADTECWSSILQLTSPGALMAHVPVGVINATPRASTFEYDAIGGLTSVTLAHLIDVIVATCGMSPYLISEKERLVAVGRHLSWFAALDFGLWKREVRDALIERWATLLRRIDQFENELSQYPPFWKAAFARYRMSLLTRIENGECIIPEDFGAASGNGDETLKEVRSVMAVYGELIQSWPSAWEQARTMGV
jgi:hypothetical protein